MRFVDAALFDSEPRETKDGYLAASVLCARTGIQQYASSEFDSSQAPDNAKDILRNNSVINVLRPEEEVFSEDSLASYVGKPITNDHPSVKVDRDTWRKYGRGGLGETVKRDGEHVRVSLALMDGEAIDDVKGGKRELSAGYECVLDWTPGDYNGTPYHAIQRNIRINHVALVDRGRAGPKARIGDSWADTKKTANPTTPKPKKTESTVDLRKITVDGFSVETTAAGVEAITNLQDKLTNLQNTIDAEAQGFDDELSALTATHDAAIAEKDSELAAKDSEIASLKKAQLSDADLDAKVAARAELISKASAMAKDADFNGKSDAQIKAMAVDAFHGNTEFTDGKSEAYIDAAFDMAKPKASNGVRDAILNQQRPAPASGIGMISDSQREYEASLANGGKYPQ